MTPERWQQIKHVFQSAIELPTAERAAFLEQACVNDPSLLSEVEALISSYEQAGGSLETMVMDMAAQMLAGQQTAPTLAQNVGHYELVKQIGAGGMGEVYLAQDSKLARKVALKLLPSHVVQDRQRLERFKQEARAASALNHPNILTIYEIGEEAGQPFIATEFIEGETLRARLAPARLPLGEALEVAVQVAAGLNAAHEAGIVHRDIKPENLMLRRDGYVKILDFGLAKLIKPQGDGPENSIQIKTDEGVVLGTPRYMSPEQARAQKVDGRTDIFSLGAVLYEMLTSHAPFEGATLGEVIVAILERQPPPLSHYVEGIPAELDQVVRKALRKDREERYPTAKALLSDLKAIQRRLEYASELEQLAQPPERRRSAVTAEARQGVRTAEVEANTTTRAESALTGIRQHKRTAVLIAGGIIVLAGAWYLVGRFQLGKVVTQTPFKNASFTQLTDQAGEEYFASLSPDGKSFVYASYASGNADLYLQRVGGRNAINLTKDSPSHDTQPAFSPNGEQIGFRSEREGGGIFVMGATGESVKRLTDFGFNPAWSPDAKEIACADENLFDPKLQLNLGSRIWVVNLATGKKRPVTQENSMQPNWSPRGTRIAYFGVRPSGQRDIWTIPAAGGAPVEVTNDQALDWNPVWSPDGKYLYFASDRSGSMNLWRIPVDENSGKVLGPSESVSTPSPYSGHVSFSRDGKRMAYVQTINKVNLQQVGFDPQRETVTGQPVWITQGSMWAGAPNLSPDGDWLAFDSQGSRQEDIFVIRRDGTSLRQLTNDMQKDRTPRWSPDGRRLAFNSNRSGNFDAVWLINSDGSGLQQLTYTSKNATGPVWSPDGARLAYGNKEGAAYIIEAGKAWQEQSPEALPVMSNLSDWFPWSWSPDGRKLAGWGVRVGISVYSFESRQYERLTNFGWGATWLSDSRRLLFQDRGRLCLVDSQSKKVREVLSVAPHGIGMVTVSRDDRLIYFSVGTTEADIWLMSLE